MLVSYEWLKRYVDINVSADALAEKLTLAGITVDLVHYPGESLSDIIAGRIMQIDRHPDADKLVVCQLDMGPDYHDFLNENGWLQIVTGAPNVKVGQMVPVAVHNACVAAGKIKKSRLRGVESFGMLCSKEELNVQPALTDEYGIWILDDEIAPGTDCIKALWLNDPVLELDLTPNRNDCQSVVNLAREVAAVLGTDLHLPKIEYTAGERKISDWATLQVKDEKLCPRYLARMIEGLEIAASPYWMQHFLGASGVRSINNVVDVSNFVMLEYGCPMHTFDYDTLGGHGIIVRRANDGEVLTTLDEQERKLTAENLLICDADDRAVCVAGVMGGLNTEITDATKNVLLEVAAFDLVSIRRTSRALGLQTEASGRYEKGVNPAVLDDVSRRTIQLLAELCGGTPVDGVLDCNAYEEKQIAVKLRPAKVNAVLGTSFAEDEIVGAMKALKFPIEKCEDGYLVEIPNYRRDIEIEEDLIEEVARLQGFDKIPTTLPMGATTEGMRTPEQQFTDNVKKALVAMGANEVINYGFISPKEWERMNLAADDKRRNTIKILNPLNEEQSIMRTTLVPGMLKTAARNLNRRNQDLLLFEQGMAFLPNDDDELPREESRVAVLATGQSGKGWATPAVEYDFYRLKGIVEALLAALKIEGAEFKQASDLSFMHPGRTAALYIKGEYAGYLGEVHPRVLANYEIKPRTMLAELDLTVLFAARAGVVRYQALPKFPAAVRDIAVVLDKSVSFAELSAAVWAAGGQYLADVVLFDVYENIGLGKNRRSLAYNLTFRCADRTLTVDEVNAAFDNILEAVRALGGELRA